MKKRIGRPKGSKNKAKVTTSTHGKETALASPRNHYLEVPSDEIMDAVKNVLAAFSVDVPSTLERTYRIFMLEQAVKKAQERK